MIKYIWFFLTNSTSLSKAHYYHHLPFFHLKYLLLVTIICIHLSSFCHFNWPPNIFMKGSKQPLPDTSHPVWRGQTILWRPQYVTGKLQHQVFGVGQDCRTQFIVRLSQHYLFCPRPHLCVTSCQIYPVYFVLSVVKLTEFDLTWEQRVGCYSYYTLRNYPKTLQG